MKLFALASWIESLPAWVQAHPTFAAFVFWPIVTALVTLAFKPRTPQEYAALAGRSPSWLWPRVAAFLQLVGALGLDPVKVLKVIAKVVTGKVAPAVLLVGAILFGVEACEALKPTCAIIHAADEVCNVIAVPLPDGGVEQVTVSGAELRTFARERKAAHAAAAAQAEGGTP